MCPPDTERCSKAGVPEDIGFQTEPDIALDQIRAALADGVAPGLVLADAGYGIDMAYRTDTSKYPLPCGAVS
ncbi:hypothetical protein ASF57_21415 [Methylobacterium sp. Leaf117]|nr:hypothetical protein ASF57_21415 [Methylobacterium sp. Leaf117]